MLRTLTITEGDSYFVKIALQKDGQPWPVAGWQFWFTLKIDPSSADADGIAQKSTAAGTIVALDATSVYVVGAPADTKGRAVGRCEFDIQGKSPEGDLYTLERGFLVIKPEYTRAA